MTTGTMEENKLCNEPIIVGSTALKYFGLNRNEPKDIDRWFVDGSLGSTNQRR